MDFFARPLFLKRYLPSLPFSAFLAAKSRRWPPVTRATFGRFGGASWDSIRLTSWRRRVICCHSRPRAPTSYAAVFWLAQTAPAGTFAELVSCAPVPPNFSRAPASPPATRGLGCPCFHIASDPPHPFNCPSGLGFAPGPRFSRRLRGRIYSMWRPNSCRLVLSLRGEDYCPLRRHQLAPDIAQRRMPRTGYPTRTSGNCGSAGLIM